MSAPAHGGGKLSLRVLRTAGRSPSPSPSLETRPTAPSPLPRSTSTAPADPPWPFTVPGDAGDSSIAAPPSTSTAPADPPRSDACPHPPADACLRSGSPDRVLLALGRCTPCPRAGTSLNATCRARAAFSRRASRWMMCPRRFPAGGGEGASSKKFTWASSREQPLGASPRLHRARPVRTPPDVADSAPAAHRQRSSTSPRFFWGRCEPKRAEGAPLDLRVRDPYVGLPSQF
jgi:transposase